MPRTRIERMTFSFPLRSSRTRQVQVRRDYDCANAACSESCVMTALGFPWASPPNLPLLCRSDHNLMQLLESSNRTVSVIIKKGDIS